MDLRELKKEVHSLPIIEHDLNKFQKNWIRPIRSNTNQHLPFLQNFNSETKKEINKKLEKFQNHLYLLKNAQLLQEQLRFSMRQIIELKLTTLKGDSTKAKLITNSLLNDDFVNMKNIINEISTLDKNVQELCTHYDEVNELLQKSLSLEESVFFMDLPHKLYLYNLVKTSQKQKTLVRRLGRHFVSLAKETQLRKRR